MAKKTAALLVLCVLALAAVQPVKAESWWDRARRNVAEFFGLEADSAEEGARILEDAEVLELEEPIEGFLAAGEVRVVDIVVPPNGTEFPNLLLTLTVLNEDEDGDADLYCVPKNFYDEINFPPGDGFSIWQSDHVHGQDIVFISREHGFYSDGFQGLQADGETPENVHIVCSVRGFAAAGTNYILELDIDYSDRELVEVEQEAMMDIFDSCCLGSPSSCAYWKSQKNEAGDVSMDFCHMRNSVCDAEGRLIRLALEELNMECEFPVAPIAKMKNLKHLLMNGNDLKGDVSKIFESFRNKDNLVQVNLADNSLTGSLTKKVRGENPICALTHGPGLAILDLSRNELEGELPECLFNAKTDIKELRIDNANLEGELPEVSPKAGLKSISLEGNSLTGPISEGVGQLESLLSINIADNKFTGPIPSSLGQASQLRSVILSGNLLEGEIPGSLATSAVIRHIFLNGNKLESMGDEWYAPESLEDSNLRIFDVENNAIQGNFPLALAHAPALSVLVLSGNNFEGRLPNVVGMFSKTSTFMIARNGFKGPIPGNLKGLGFFQSVINARSAYQPALDMSGNQLSGKIPQFLHAQNVREILWNKINLGGNDFNLPCPLSLNLIHIQDLFCGEEEEEENDTEVTLVAETDLRDRFAKDGIKFANGDAPAPAPEGEEEGDLDEMAPAPAPVASVVSTLDVDAGTVELSSVEVVDEEADAEEEKVRDRALNLNGVKSLGRKGEPEKSTVSKAGASTGSSMILVLGASVFIVIIVSVVIIVVVKKRKSRSTKSSVVDDVATMDLEMQSNEIEEEKDDIHMLEGVKPSSSAL